MALTHVATSTWVVGTGTVQPTTPTGTAIGDLTIVTVHSKYDDASAGDIAGWTDIAPAAFNTGRSTGNDNGNTRTKSIYRIWQTGDTIAMPTLAPTPNNVSAAKATTYRATTGLYDISGVAVADDSTGTPLLFAATGGLGATTNDLLHIDYCLNSDVATFGATSVALTGVVLGTLTANVAAGSTTSGTDMRYASYRQTVTSGTASGNWNFNQALAGTTTNSVGTAAMYRIREAPLPAVTLAGFQFFADGTQTGAAVLHTQGTNLPANLTSGDLNCALRVRLQSTSSAALPTTDDWALQWEKNGDGSWNYVAGSSDTVMPYSSALLVDGGATTQRLAGGTGTFEPGTVTEQGTVTDEGWAGNNFTELLYSITFKAAFLGDGDLVAFRVLRNGGTTGMTYSSVPYANITKTAATPKSGSESTAITVTESSSITKTVYKGGPTSSEIYRQNFSVNDTGHYTATGSATTSFGTGVRYINGNGSAGSVNLTATGAVNGIVPGNQYTVSVDHYDSGGGTWTMNVQWYSGGANLAFAGAISMPSTGTPVTRTGGPWTAPATADQMRWTFNPPGAVTETIIDNIVVATTSPATEGIDSAAISVTESSMVVTSSANLTETFANDTDWRTKFTQVSGSETIVASGGKLVFPYNNAAPGGNGVSTGVSYTLAPGANYTIEIAAWPLTMVNAEDFFVSINGWDTLTFAGDGGGDVFDTVDTLLSSAGYNVKYITYSNVSGNLVVTLRDAGSSILATRNHTGFPFGTTSKVGFTTNWGDFGATSDTFEVESVTPTAPSGGADPKSGSETRSLSVAESSNLLRYADVTGFGEFFDDSSWTNNFDVTHEGAAPYQSNGRLVLPVEATVGTGISLFTDISYTIEDQGSMTIEIGSWLSLAATQLDDFYLGFNAWGVGAYVNGGKLYSSDGPTVLANDYRDVKYISWERYANTNLQVFAADKNNQVLGSDTWSSGQWYSPTTISVDLYYAPNGTLTSTFEIDSIHSGYAFFTEKSATDSAAITITDGGVVVPVDTSTPINATDTVAVTVTDTSSLAITATKSATDTAAITVTESSALFKTMVSTDGAAISVSDVTTSITGQITFKSATDTAAITVTDVSSTMVKSTTSTDQAALAVVESTALSITKVATDAASIAVTEVAGLASSLPGQDSATLGVTEQTSFQNTQTASDGSAISVAEVASLFISKAATDASAIAVADTGAVSSSDTKSATDSAAISVAEAAALTKNIAVTDAAAITVSEQVTIFRALSATETSAVTVTETAGNSVTQATTDTISISVAESTSFSNTLSTTDISSISITDSGIVYQDTTIPGSESIVLSVIEQTSLVKSIPVTDTVSLTLSELVVTLVTVSAVDGGALVTNETAHTQKPVTAVDTTAISVVESVAGSNTLASTDTSAISVADVATVPAVSLSLTDAAAISVTDTATTLVTLSAVDGGSLAVTEDSNFGVVPITGSDTASLAVSEAKSFANTVTATDVTAISVNDVSASFRTIAVTDQAALSVSDVAAGSTSPNVAEVIALTVAETTALFKTLVASESNALAVTENRNLSSNLPGQDSASVGVTETSSVFVTIARSDTSAVSVTEATATTNAVNASDLGSIAATETATIFTTRSATDTSAITLTEAPGVISGVGASSAVDTSSIAVTEARSVLVQVSANDTNSLAVYEIVSGSNTVVATDASAISVTETAVPLTFLARTDGAAISVADTGLVGGANTLSATDTAAVAVTESRTIAVTLSANDTTALSITESTGQAGNQPGQDSLTIGLTESASIFTTRSAADQASINVSDTRSPIIVVATKAATDTVSVGVTETAAIIRAFAATDTATLSVTESVSGSNTVSHADTAALTVTESRAIVVGVASSDTSSLSVSEATQFAYATIPVNATDTSSLSVSETRTQFVTVFAFDQAAITVGEPNTGGATTATASDTIALSVAESTTRFVTLTASDEAAIILTDTSTLTFYRDATDTLTIALGETGSVFAVDVYRTYVYVYRGGTWREGPVLQWRDGAWRPVQVLTYKNGGWVDNTDDD